MPANRKKHRRKKMPATRVKRSRKAMPSMRMKRRRKKHAEPTSKAFRKLLGTMPDKILAQKFNTTPAYVRDLRSAKKIRSYQDRRRAQIDKSLLGKIPDKVLARKYGYSHTAIANFREAMGIPALPPGGPRLYEHIKKKKSVIKMLGTDIDRNIARIVGVPTTVIFSMRKQHGIPASRARYYEELPPEKRVLLGKDFDSNIAEKLGVCLATVIRYRRKLGIPAYRRPAVFRSNEPISWLPKPTTIHARRSKR